MHTFRSIETISIQQNFLANHEMPTHFFKVDILSIKNLISFEIQFSGLNFFKNFSLVLDFKLMQKSPVLLFFF